MSTHGNSSAGRGDVTNVPRSVVRPKVVPPKVVGERVSALLGEDPFHRRSLVVLSLLAAAAVLYLFIPLSGSGLRNYYNVIAIGAMLVALKGVAHNRPSRRRGWLLVIGGFSGWVLGDLVYSVEEQVWQGLYYPVPSDAVYLGAYGFLAAGVLVMVRTRRAGRDMTALLDASIIATGAAVVAAVFVIGPLASDSELTTFGKVTSSAYPIGDVLLIAVLVRMWAAPGALTTSFRLLVSALALTLTSDVLWNVLVVMNGMQSDRWTDALYLASYIMVSAAACAPSMTTLAEPAPDREQTKSSHRRLVVLACGTMLPAVALMIDGASGGEVLWPVIGVGALLISGLVLLRMSGILRTVETQAVQLAALARSDALTGAPNRRTWDHELSRACATSLEQGTSLCIAMMDIDHFKVYNDTHGHQAGDRLLREAVARWTERLGTGALLARYGGEEFAVLLPGLSLTEAQARIQTLSAVTPDGQTFSAGVAMWEPRTPPASAVASADQALYQAKRAGRDRVVTYGDQPSVDEGPAPLPTLNVDRQPTRTPAGG
ncbi:MAG TPA: diguanylate cyclase [Nocardioidaceae bacterium]|nr:diguanylate cyclase [Nocardioidaceae bacterium]